MQVRRETPFHHENLASGNLGVFVSVCLFESLLLVLGLPATVNLRTILVGPGLPFSFFCGSNFRTFVNRTQTYLTFCLVFYYNDSSFIVRSEINSLYKCKVCETTIVLILSDICFQERQRFQKRPLNNPNRSVDSRLLSSKKLAWILTGIANE